MDKTYDTPKIVNEFAAPRDDEEPLTVDATWTKEEEAKAKRKSVHHNYRPRYVPANPLLEGWI
jgi:hypothetical protein